MSEAEQTPDPGTPQSAPPGNPPRRQLFRRRPAEPAVPHADPGAENTVVMEAPQPTEIIRASEAAPPASEAGGPDPQPEESPSRGALERERRDLVDRREEQVYHLGGLAFEMHRRGTLPAHVLRLRADDVAATDARIREIDERLDQIETERAARREEDRVRRAAKAAPVLDDAGSCAACGTPFRAEAKFCWSCGRPVAVPEADAPATPDADAA